MMSIYDLLETVKDYRKAKGKRYSLGAVLRLIYAGLLAGANTLASIYRWGESLTKKELTYLGFIKGKLPCYSNLTIMLSKLDPEDLTRIARKMQPCSGRPVFNIDGKFLNGSDAFGEKEQKQILTAFWEIFGATAYLQEIEGRDEYKAMLKLLQKSDIKGAIITADAAFTHEEILEEAVKGGADFAISLKGNEPNLLENTQKAFDKSYRDKSEIKTFEEVIDCIHGRIEKRSIEVIDMPYEYLNGHRHIKQLCKITRLKEHKNKPYSATKEVAYMVTSLNNTYSPEYLLKLNRGHWACENKLNWIKDSVFLEDRSSISTGATPIVMSLLRSLAIQLIYTVSRKITETREFFNNNRFILWRKFASHGCDF